jgi:sugar/nucleoside kinase (ribokinase family)
MAIWDVVGVGANSVDYVYRLPTYPQPDSPTAKLRIASHRVSFGGQTTTALCTCAALGLRAKYIGTFGNDDSGRRIREEVARHGVDLEDACVREAPNPFAVILLAEGQGERIVLWDRDRVLALRDDELKPDVIRGARLVHVDDVDANAAIRAAGIARQAGLPVTSDIEALTDRTDALVEAVTIPIFAEHVLRALTGEDDVERALRKVRRTHEGVLCVTLGSRGAMLLDGDRLHHEPGLPVNAVDTTGAGDVFRGAFIYALLRGDAPADLLRFANAAAAMSCTREGAIASVATLSALEQDKSERRDRQRQ